LLLTVPALFCCTGARVNGTLAFRAVCEFANAGETRPIYRRTSAAVWVFSIFAQPAAADRAVFLSVFAVKKKVTIGAKV